MHVDIFPLLHLYHSLGVCTLYKPRWVVNVVIYLYYFRPILIDDRLERGLFRKSILPRLVHNYFFQRLVLDVVLY